MEQSSSIGFYQKLLYQDEFFIKYCKQIPESFNLRLTYNEDSGTYRWLDNSGNNFESQISISNLISRDCLLISAAVYGKDHLLDGHTYMLIVKISNYNNYPKLEIICKPSPCTEPPSSSLGLFTGGISFWRKILCCGRIWNLLCGERAVEKTTAHQPLYFPQVETFIFAGLTKYHCYNLKSNSFGWEPNFASNHYLCMHPHYDQSKERMLTYSFVHSSYRHRTNIVFYEFSATESEQVHYQIEERVILHMFGFTENYFILFTTPLKLRKKGQCHIICGSPLLSELDDNFTSNLIIHFVPRVNTMLPFIIDTELQGYIYHSINCYERSDNSIIIDAFVSQLNPIRESSQFEMRDGGKIFDNHGDPYRFLIKNPMFSNEANLCQYKLLTSIIDSSIDFHCINQEKNGLKHSYIWMVGCERKRNGEGCVEEVMSTLYKISCPEDDLSFDARETVTHSYNEFGSNKINYLRTPMFIPAKESKSEDEGYIYSWLYSSSPSHELALLIFDSQTLDQLIKIDIPDGYHIPYSVHSWSYTFLDDNTNQILE